MAADACSRKSCTLSGQPMMIRSASLLFSSLDWSHIDAISGVVMFSLARPSSMRRERALASSVLLKVICRDTQQHSLQLDPS